MHEEIRYLNSDEPHPFIVEMAGISYCDGSYRIFRPRSPVAVFEYVLSGYGSVQVDQQHFQAGPGDVYLLPQNCRHEYAADPRNPWIKIWFNIRGPLVESLLHAYQLQQVTLIRQCPAELADLFQRFLLAARAERPLPELFEQCALVYHQILIALARQVRSLSQAVPSEADCLQAFIRRHLCEPIGLSDLAKLIYRSPAYTIRIFRESFRQTPCAYLAACRIEAARQLLAGTQVSIKAIAGQFCYADQHYFANVFRRATGQSPRQYRQSCRN